MKLILSKADGDEEKPVVIEIADNPRVESEVLIGRGNDCDMQIMEPFISRHHCGIVVDTTARAVRIRDLGSRNGTFVNDRRVAGMCDLQDGDKVTVGFLPLKIAISGNSSVWDRAAARSRDARIGKPRRMNIGSMVSERPSSRGNARP